MTRLIATEENGEQFVSRVEDILKEYKESN